MLPAPVLLGLALLIAFLVLLPARRLQLAGLSSRTIGSYALILWILGFALAVRPAGTRFLIPILIVAWIAPFIVAPHHLARVVRRGRGAEAGPADAVPPPIKNITPPDPPDEPGHPPG